MKPNVPELFTTFGNAITNWHHIEVLHAEHIHKQTSPEPQLIDTVILYELAATTL